MFFPPSAALEWPGWVSPAVSELWPLRSVRRTLQTSSSGHFPHGNPWWGRVTEPVFWMLFLDVLALALRGLWKALCAPGGKHGNETELSLQGPLGLWSPAFFFLW